MDTVGTRVKQIREERGISRPQLASMTGIGYSTLSELERGGMQTTTKLRVIADALGVSLRWLETGRGARTKDVLNGASQPVGLDVERLQTSIGYVIDAYLYTETPINSRGVARLAAGVYDYLVTVESPNLVELGDRLKKQVQGGKHVGQGKAGSVDADVHGGTQRRAAG